ncbi:MAG TPA: DUF4041 domain-containing protein [Acidimicrobiales bacterium]|nr:DUF4041 domain-containing protein [Acidimicrobiales bacterium]
MEDAKQVLARPVPQPPVGGGGGLFGGKRALEAEVRELRSFIDGFGFPELEALRNQVDALAARRKELDDEVGLLGAEREAADAALVKVREVLILQEVGVYDYHHRLEDSVAYKEPLADVQSRIKAMAMKDGGAVTATNDWTVNGSQAEGRKMVRELSKLMLRAYNAEADRLVQTMRPYKLDAAVDRLTKARETISRLGRTMNINVSSRYHRLRIDEMRLTADYLAKVEEEKEAEREEKARLREEAKARKEFEAEKARLLKEQAHYLNAVAQMRANGDDVAAGAAEVKLAEINDAIHGVEAREANIRAGYVYVISNVGAFGERMVKIGMTRRLEPMDRVRELGDASVPFRYDVHAIVFSDDAVGLEARLHDALAARRVNRVNLRREFFYATPGEVEALLTSFDGSLLSFVEHPEAEEWHQSENVRRAAEDLVVAEPVAGPRRTRQRSAAS